MQFVNYFDKILLIKFKALNNPMAQTEVKEGKLNKKEKIKWKLRYYNLTDKKINESIRK